MNLKNEVGQNVVLLVGKQIQTKNYAITGSKEISTVYVAKSRIA